MRNLNRMQQLYDAVRHRDVPEIDEVGEWLKANTPEQRDVTLTHGDYKLDNVMYAPAEPMIVAVVDWEISTIGDPMVDLGWMLYFSPESAGEDLSGAGVGAIGGGYPSRADLAKRYAEPDGTTDRGSAVLLRDGRLEDRDHHGRVEPAVQAGRQRRLDVRCAR